MFTSTPMDVHRTERMTAIAGRSAIARHHSGGIGCSSQVAQPTEPRTRILLDTRRVSDAVEHIPEDLRKVSVTHVGYVEWTALYALCRKEIGREKWDRYGTGKVANLKCMRLGLDAVAQQADFPALDRSRDYRSCSKALRQQRP
jgi:hypothetical protein